MVWTDTLQTVLMVLGVLAVIILGTISVGGVGVVFSRAAATERLELFKWVPGQQDLTLGDLLPA